ncbi:hypothetical protein PFISCL1PPCAC_603, partial [Pristionchus fissidentatus]
QFRKLELNSFKCSKAADDAEIFTKPGRFALTESVILMADSGAILPEWMTPEVIGEAREVNSKTLRWQLGLGEFRDEKILKFNAGQLLDTLIEGMKSTWECRGAATPAAACKKVFHAYSTHDYILNVMLELLG